MSEKLKKSLLYTYGIGDLCFTLLVCMEVYFFNAFLTDYAKFSLDTCKIITYATGAGDILFAFLAGVVIQKVTLKFGGKYRSWLLVTPPLVVLLFLFQFSKIGSEYLAAAFIIFGFLTSHLFWNVGYAAIGGLMGSITKDPDERTIMSSSRAQGQSAGNLLFSYTGGLMVPIFTVSIGLVYGFSVTILIFGVLMILGYLYLYKMTAGMRSVESDAVPAETAAPDKKSVGEIVGLVLKNPPLLFLMLADTFRNTCLFFILSFAFYYFGYVLNNPDFLKVFMLANGIGTLLGAIAATWIGVKIGKRHAYGLSCFVSALVFLSAAFIEPGAWSFTIIFSIAAMIACAAQAMATALYADTAVYGEWKSGKNNLGFIMSMMMLPLKFGLLIRYGIINQGLDSIGYVVGGAEQTQGVVSGISAIMIYTPAITSVLAAVIFYLGYRIGEKDIVRMQDELAAR